MPIASALQRRKEAKERMNKRRALETVSETQTRNADNRKRMRANRANESPQEADDRKAVVRNKKTSSMASETPTDSQQRRARDNLLKLRKKAEQTKQETEKRRADEIKGKLRKSTEETQEEKEEKRPDDNMRKRAKRETDMQLQLRKKAEQTQQVTEIRRADDIKRKLRKKVEETQEQKKRADDNMRKRANREVDSFRVSIQHDAETFKSIIKEGPIYACCSCHRLLYRRTVKIFKEGLYPHTDHTNRIIQNSRASYLLTHDNSWICTTCHVALKKRRIPTQSWVNGLSLHEVPPELKDLRPLELRLISLRIPFMKLVGLPKGGQKAIHGSAVNVPAKLDSVTSLLPRLPHTAQVVPLKIKRKLAYKGHYMHEYIRPKKVMDAVKWLVHYNPLYVDVDICHDWVSRWESEDGELWEAMANINSKPTVQGTTTVADTVPITTIPTANTYSTLEAIAANHRYAIIDVQRDGNCFFHAVSASLAHVGVQPITGPDIRAKLIHYLDNNDNCYEYANFITIPNSHIHDQQLLTVDDRAMQGYRAYVDGLRTGEWADNLAVQAVADMLDINFSILNTLTPDWIHDVYPRSGRSPHTITMGLIGEQHYVALQKLSGGTGVIHDLERIVQTRGREAQDDTALDNNSTLRGVTFDTLLQEEHFINQDDTFSVAPAENQTPCAFLTDPHFEVLANPDKFPTAVGAWNATRPVHITLRKYFGQRLMNVDYRFVKDMDYLLAAQYTTESNQVKSDLSINLRQTHGTTFQNKRLNAGLLKNPTNLQAMIRTDTAFRFLKNIRGSPAFWKTVLLDLLAMVRQLGIPTWFLTLSAADLHWPEVIQSIAHQYGQSFSDQDLLDMSWEVKCHWLRCNPITAARQFQHRLEQFFKLVLLGKGKPIGKVVDYMIRVEFQARGSPHAHCILWIQDAPQIGVNTDEEVASFIATYQTCHIPDDEQDADLRQLILTRQKHVHSSTCRRNGKCRFNFPQPPSNRTCVAKPIATQDPLLADSQLKKYEDICRRVREIMERNDVPDDISLQKLLELAKVTFDQYHQALMFTQKGYRIVLKRQPSERFINYYNADILRVWRANIDIQFITDYYACVAYVSSYMLKSEKHMGELLHNVAEEAMGEDIKSKLRKVGSAFLNNREVSAQEAAYRLLSMPLKKATRTVVFVNTAPKHKRVALLKTKTTLEKMDNLAENIFCTSLLDRYISRPDQLQNMCYAEFAANYATSYNINSAIPADHTPSLQQEPDDNDDDSASANSYPTVITLKNGLGSMKKRKRCCIIRFHKDKSEGEEKYRGILMLYFPWRNEDTDLLAGFQSFQDHYRTVTHIVHNNEVMFTKNAGVLQEALDDLDLIGPPQHAWDALAPGARHQQAEQEDEGFTDERHLPEGEMDSNIDLGTRTKKATSELHARFSAELGKSLMTSQQYIAMMRSLNTKQLEVIQIHRKWCKQMIYALKNKQPTPVYRLFLSGPGGVGKSHIIKLVHYETMKLLKTLSGHFDPDDLPLLLTAFTGTAAFAIEGMTLHSAFSFSCGPGSKKTYQPASSERLNTLRSRLSKLKLLIIDEVSMVGADLLYHIHRRLQDIMGTIDPDSRFGNVSILAVGDLYQLQPVAQPHVFSPASDTYAKLHGSLWAENFKMIELTENMRQKDDQAFAQLLLRVRTATCTQADLDLLRSTDIRPTDPGYPHEALHVFKTNKQVDEHNLSHISKLPTQVFRIKAIDKKKDLHTGLINVAISTKPSHTGGLRDIISVAVGARVMINVNIDVGDGLANGVCGTITGIEHNNTVVDLIFVKFDSDRVGRQAIDNSEYKVVYPAAVPIKRMEVQFSTGQGRQSVEAKRIQFPLTLAWGCTIHKVQGKTMDEIVVSMKGRGRFLPGQAYVAFSRVKTLHGLHIIGFDATAIRVNPSVEQEMNRLINISQPSPKKVFFSDVPNSLKISLLNIRSYLLHVEDLKGDPAVPFTEVFCFVETFLREGVHLGELCHPSSNLCSFRTDRPITSGVDKGGIMNMALASLHPIAINISISGIECSGITIHKYGTTINIITVYRAPSASMPNFYNGLSNLIDSLPNTASIVLGDFNIDLLKSPNHHIVGIMQQYGFRQHVTSPTTNYGSLLDHVYVNANIDVCVEVMDTYYSDHDMIGITISI